MVGMVTGVLDIKDDTPLITSSNSQTPAPHNRSIVVLTPMQAIKFTALSRERHVSWLTALNFLVHNDPNDLIIPRGISSSASNGSLWGRETTYPGSATASSITSSQMPSQPVFLPPPVTQPPFSAQFGSYTVRKNSLPDFAPSARDDTSALGYKIRHDEEYAKPPSVPRIPTGKRWEIRERSGSGSNVLNWDDLMNSRETIRMDAFVRRDSVTYGSDIDENLFREF